MSLNAFLARRDVREKFREEFPKPKLAENKELLALPLSKRYSLVGTAFDYLLRFYLERLNPKATQRRWVAEAGLAKLGARCQMTIDVDSGKTSIEDTDEFKLGRAAFNRARAARDRYIAIGKITDSLLKGVISLAQLDVVFRSGFIDAAVPMPSCRGIGSRRSFNVILYRLCAWFTVFIVAPRQLDSRSRMRESCTSGSVGAPAERSLGRPDNYNRSGNSRPSRDIGVNGVPATRRSFDLN
jgi:hypothetical protein